ncbi:MAG: radical SAM protein [Pseudomonadota bacterium]
MSSYVFGPVASRRLGRSLGVDLVPHKTCTFDCVYCQVGRTTCRTIQRKEWVPVEEVLQAVREKISLQPDYITFSGSGEPTLHAGIGELISEIKKISKIPVAVLTNGSLLWQPEVRVELAGADLVVPSLDAATQEAFMRVNQPSPEINIEKLVEGLIAFRESFAGQYWLEVFLLQGITDSEEQVHELAKLVQQINPDRVQLNTVARPPADSTARAVPREKMDFFRGLFGEKAEVIAQFAGSKTDAGTVAKREDLLIMLRRRPCTIADVAVGLRLHETEVSKLLKKLLREDLVEIESVEGLQYFRAKT